VHFDTHNGRHRGSRHARPLIITYRSTRQRIGFHPPYFRTAHIERQLLRAWPGIGVLLAAIDLPRDGRARRV